jgi:hypothetical protein
MNDRGGGSNLRYGLLHYYPAFASSVQSQSRLFP